MTKARITTIGKILNALQNNKDIPYRREIFQVLREKYLCTPSLETLTDFDKKYDNEGKDRIDNQEYDEELGKEIRILLEFEICEPGTIVRQYLKKQPLNLDSNVIYRLDD